jgi:hypothetical protein
MPMHTHVRTRAGMKAPATTAPVFHDAVQDAPTHAPHKRSAAPTAVKSCAYRSSSRRWPPRYMFKRSSCVICLEMELHRHANSRGGAHALTRR